MRWLLAGAPDARRGGTGLVDLHLVHGRHTFSWLAARKGLVFACKAGAGDKIILRLLDCCDQLCSSVSVPCGPLLHSPVSKCSSQGKAGARRR